jgi:hypothetical protein
MERVNPKILKKVGGKEKYSGEVSNRFAVLEDLDAEVEIKSAWEKLRENTKISAKQCLFYYGMKHKLWLDKWCRKLLDPRKQAILQWLQDPSEGNGDYLNNVKM